MLLSSLVRPQRYLGLDEGRLCRNSNDGRRLTQITQPAQMNCTAPPSEKLSSAGQLRDSNMPRLGCSWCWGAPYRNLAEAVPSTRV